VKTTLEIDSVYYFSKKFQLLEFLRQGARSISEINPYALVDKLYDIKR